MRIGRNSRDVTGGQGGPPAEDHAAARARATKLFDRGQKQFRRRRFGKAAEFFAAAEAEIEGFRECFNWVVTFRLRRAFCLYALSRWGEALAIFEGLIADHRKLKAAGLEDVYNGDRFPDEIPAIYWTRVLCLRDLGRLREARDAIPDLIEQIGSGTTPTQRAYLGDAYLLQARVAESESDYEQALRAADSALAHCSGYDEPWVEEARNEAEQLREVLQARQ